MGKKEKKIITLSEVDHKLQFINIIAVIGDITPIINRSRKLVRIELCLLDETVSRPGFSVKMHLECEMLNNFLDVAKKGFIIQLKDMKVVKNEGEVYGEVNDEEEVTLYKDNGQTLQWFPAEKPTLVTGAIQAKVLSVVKWKKANLKDLSVMQENHDEKTRTKGRSHSEDKRQTTTTLNEGYINKDSTVSNITDNKSISKENIHSSPLRNKQKLSTPKNESAKRFKGNKKSSSSEEIESSSANSSRTSILSNSSRLTRQSDVSDLKSLNLSSLDKSRTLKKSFCVSTINKSKIRGMKKSVNKSEFKINLKDSDVSSSTKKSTKPFKEMRENRSISSSPIRVTRLTINAEDSEVSSNKKKSTKRFKEMRENKSISSSPIRVGRFKTNAEDSGVSSNTIRSTKNLKEMRENINISVSPSRIIRSSDVSDLKSSTLYSLNKSSTSRTRHKSLSPSRSSQSRLISEKDDSICLSGMKKSQSVSKLNKSNVSSSSESESLKFTRLNQSSRTSLKNKITRSSDSDVNDTDTNSDQIVFERESRINLIINCKHGKENEKSKSEDPRIDDTKEKIKESRNFKTNFKTPIKADPKENENRSNSEEKVHTFETLKRTRQKTKSNNDDSNVETSSPGSSPNNSNLRKSETKIINETAKAIPIGNSMIAKTKKDSSGSDSPSNKRLRLSVRNKDSSIASETPDSSTSFEDSPKPKPKQRFLRRNPTLNSSDSTLSEISNFSVNKTSSGINNSLTSRTRGKSLSLSRLNQSRLISGEDGSVSLPGLNKSQSLSKLNESNVSSGTLRQKRGANQIDKSSERVYPSRKKFKLDSGTDSNKSRDSSPNQENFSVSSDDKKSTPKHIKPNETATQRSPKEDEETTVKEAPNSKQVLKLSQSEKRKAEKAFDDSNLEKGDKKSTSYMTRKQVLHTPELNVDISKKNTRNSVNTVENSIKRSRESGKCGIYETYLKPLTKKLNFSSVHDLTDISLCDLEQVYVPDKFDLQCKVISDFVLAEDSIQVIRVQDGTICKCATLKVPLGHTWDDVSKEILDNPIVEVKSQFIDIIVFNYFRLNFPFKSDNYYRINNVMAVKFQLKKDPRKQKVSNAEYFFCVQGQDANNRRLFPQQRKEVEERISALSQKSILATEINRKGIAEEPVSNLPILKPPVSPIKDGKRNVSPDKKSPLKSKPISDERSSVEKPELNEQNCLEPNIGPEIVHQKDKSIAKKGSKLGKLKNSETCKDKLNTGKNLDEKVNTVNLSDETILGETPPLLREISEIMHEESALGLPFTATEDVHLKNSGSEVTFSQFCEGAKLKADNFRTSTQTFETDVQMIGSSIGRTSPKGGLAANDEVIPPEDSSKMEPLVYCPSGSSGSSAAVASPDKGQASQDSQCSASVICGAQVKTISQLEPSNSENQQVINEITSDLSNSSSVKVINSDSSAGTDLELLGSKTVVGNKNLSSSKLNEVEPTIPHVAKDLPINQQNNVSQSLKAVSSILDHVIESSIVNVSNSGENVNKVNNDDIETVSDESSGISLLDVDGKKTKPTSSSNANLNDDISVHDVERSARLIPDRCFYKSCSSASAPTLTELELDEIYDDENSSIKYFSCQTGRSFTKRAKEHKPNPRINPQKSSYAQHLMDEDHSCGKIENNIEIVQTLNLQYVTDSRDRNLPMLTFHVIEKLKNTNSLTLLATFISIIPAFTDSWKEKAIKARCPSCEKMYEVFNAANNKNNADASASAAIAVGCHIVCPDSQCCNKILEKPEFHFSVELKLQDGSQVTALLGGEAAEQVFGCSASEAMRDESAANRVAEILEKISVRVSDKRPTRVVVTREDISDPTSGPLCIASVSF